MFPGKQGMSVSCVPRGSAAYIASSRSVEWSPNPWSVKKKTSFAAYAQNLQSLHVVTYSLLDLRKNEVLSQFTYYHSTTMVKDLGTSFAIFLSNVPTDYELTAKVGSHLYYAIKH